MKWMRASMWSIAVLALFGLAASFFVEAAFLGRAVVVQPIERDPKSDTGWRLVGAPATLLNVPASAFVTQAGPGIPAQVDADLLRKDLTVVPFEPIRQTINTARWGAIIAEVLMLAGLVSLRRLTFVIPDEENRG
jgi:hypothetical protein